MHVGVSDGIAFVFGCSLDNGVGASLYMCARECVCMCVHVCQCVCT